MAVTIREVTSKKELKRWVEFPNKLYKHEPMFVPFLTADELGTFNKKSNPAYAFCETKLFLAYKDEKIVGRIAALINHAANKKWGTSNIRFTRFDFIDDFEVSSALFNEVVKWGKERGFETVSGPHGFTDMDHEGMLIEGFDELNMSITFYNFPYYETHYERLGLKKDVDWVEYFLTVPNKHDERISKISSYIKERNGYQIVTYKTAKEIKNDAFTAFKVIDEAFSVLYGTVPLTDEVINQTVADNIPLMNLKYICSVKDRSGNLIGFAVLVPSIAKALKKSNGKLFPFGIFRLLKALKLKGNDTLEMFFIAVKPEYQSKGVPAVIMDHIMKVLIENGVKYCETGPELEDNVDVQSMWKGFDARRHKRRRCYKKSI